MSEPVLSWKRQDAQDAVETLETFDKHGLPAFVRGVDAEALYFFLALFRTGTLPRCGRAARHQSLERNRMLAKLRTYWDDPLFVRSGFLMQPTTAAKRRYDKVLSFMHVLEDLRRDDELDPRTLSRTVRTACYDNAFALCIASIFADFTARMPHVRLRAMQADEHLFDYLREDLLDLVFFARQGLHPDVHSVALLTTPYVCLVRRGHPLSERAALWGLLNAKILKPSRRCSSMPSPTATVLPTVPATAELALDPRRTAMLQLSDAAPKLTVRLGWHERTHADPGSQLIRAQLLALIQKRFGRPAGE